MENAKRNKSSKHNINLGFQDRWQPHSIEPKALKLVYNYRSASPKRRNTPIRIPKYMGQEETRNKRRVSFKIY